MRRLLTPFRPPTGSLWLVAAGRQTDYEWIIADGLLVPGDLVQLNLPQGGHRDFVAARVLAALRIPGQAQEKLAREGLEQMAECNYQRARGALALFAYANSEPVMEVEEAKARIRYAISEVRRARAEHVPIRPWTPAVTEA